MSSWGLFPVEIITNILSRLPVNSLIRFKIVSKPWFSIITSPDFIKLHLENSLKTNTNHAIFAQSLNGIFRIDIQNQQPTTNATLIHSPLLTHDSSTTVLGSCNGLLALLNSKEDILIWNPSTQEHVKVPFTEILVPQNAFCAQGIVFGFGYDGISDFDYKLVRIVVFYTTTGRKVSEVKLFSLRDRCWKNGPSFQYGFKCGSPGQGVLVGDALHWIASRDVDLDDEDVLVSFDLGSEKFRELDLPVIQEEDACVNLDVLGGKLIVLCNDMRTRMNVWMMKDYGVKESWIKLAVVTNQSIGNFHYAWPMVYSKDGNEVLFEQDGYYFVWFDLLSKRGRRARVSGLPRNFESVVVVESLVPLVDDGGGSKEIKSDGKQKKGEQGKKKKKRDDKKRDDFLSSGFKLVL